MMKSDERQTDSGTTGLLSLGNAVESAIGRLHGGTGSGVAIPPETEKWAAAITDHADHRHTDRKARASMIRALGIQTRSASSVIIPNDEPSYDITDRCELFETDGFAPGNYSRAVVALTALSAPPTPDDMLAGIGMLMTVTAHREYASNDIKSMAAIYTHALRLYPRDCVLEAIHEWPRRKDGKWMPTVHDLDKIIRRKVSWRRCALEAAKNAAEAEKDH